MLLLLPLFLFHVAAGKLKSGNVGQTSPVEGILKESLRSNRVQACDGERITLSCPRNTQISVQTGFYGRVVPESQLCPPRKPSHLDALHHSNVCDVIQAHTRISELCDKRRKCTVVVDSNTFEDDPCPTTSKYLQMAYGCMPVSFEEETFCTPKPSEPPRAEIRLECREGRRLAIYSAQMRTSPQCSDTEIRYECASDVLPPVLRQCHARESCTLKTEDVKGHCRHGHLHIVYVCVNEEIFSEEAIKGELVSLEAYLKEAAALEKEDDERFFRNVNDQKHYERITDGAPVVTEDTSVHQIANDASYVTHDEYRMNQHDPPPVTEKVEPNLVGLAHDVLQIVEFIKTNKEKAAMCVVLAVSMATIVVLSACIVTRLCSSPKDSRTRNSSRSRRSLETSKLVSSNYGGSITPHMQDIEDEQFLRFSIGSSKPTSNYSNYDF